jgi:2-polyprenyl-3-methyl-5-hydroxy-6-metoxy-1,4-benzoquinol methylase
MKDKGANAGQPMTPARLMEMMWGYAPILVLEAALNHGVFDVLDSGTQNLTEISQRTGTSERGLRAILNALVALDLLAGDGAGQFSLTPISRSMLVSTKPAFQGAVLRNTSRMMLSWLQLTNVVRTGYPAKVLDAEQYRDSVASLFPLSYGAAHVLAWSLNLTSAPGPVHVLDIGSGSGVWGIALARSSAQVAVTAIDWEQVITVTKEMAAKYSVGHQFTFLAADLHDADFGKQYDIAILGHVLHGEGETNSKLLLKKAFAALKPGGTIVIAEFLVDRDRTGPLLSLLFAISMLVNTTRGDTFSFEEIQEWLQESGFRNPRKLDVPGPSPLILATRPGSEA